MLAIDTNVVIRYFANDDHGQFLRAKQLIEREPVFLCDTVLMECEWVLRSAFDFDAGQFVDAIRGLAGLPTINLESPKWVAKALEWHKGGMDFADAMHLVRAESCEAFVSFDELLAKAAGKVGAKRVRTP